MRSTSTIRLSLAAATIAACTAVLAPQALAGTSATISLPASAPSGPGPSEPPAGAHPPPPAVDWVAPDLELGGERRQALGPVLDLYATCNEPCEFDALARVHGVRGLREVHVVTPAKAGEGGRRVRFEVRLGRRAQRLFRRALRAGHHPMVVVEVYAIDLAENETDHTFPIRVHAPEPGPGARR